MDLAICRHTGCLGIFYYHAIFFEVFQLETRYDYFHLISANVFIYI